MQWTRGHTIGHGSTATVSVATITTTSHHGTKTFAVKSVELSKSELLQTEQKMLHSLNHPRIVSYKGYDVTFENNNYMFNLLMEYMAGGMLSDTIKKSGGRLEESTIRCYTRQIIEGLDYLHSIGVVHCDIKGQNILTGQNGYNCKIADFGCAKWLTPANPVVPIAGTPLFMSPEVARGEEQRYASDIWALGCTILEMFTGFSPWPNATNATSLLYQIGILGDSPEMPENISDQAKDFLNKCLIRDPKERWTAKQLLKHQFINEIVSCNLKMENQDLCLMSPTSILDSGLWNSVDESTTLMECMIMEKSPASALPDRRLGLWMLNSDRPNWIWDENWITVRNRGEEEVGITED